MSNSPFNFGLGKIDRTTSTSGGPSGPSRKENSKFLMRTDKAAYDLRLASLHKKEKRSIYLEFGNCKMSSYTHTCSFNERQ